MSYLCLSKGHYKVNNEACELSNAINIWLLYWKELCSELSEVQFLICNKYPGIKIICTINQGL